MEHKKEINSEYSGLMLFDPVVLLIDIAKRWLLIVLAVLIVGVGTYIVVDSAYEPEYRTNTTFVVTNRGSSSTVYANLSSTTSLANIFSELLNSSLLHKTIAEETGIYSYNCKVTTAVIPETNLITMQVTGDDPKTTFVVTQAIIDHHEKLTYEVVGGISLEVLQSPVVPGSPANVSNASHYMKRMMLLAAVAMIAVIGWISFTRDSVRSEREAKKKLNCSCLGEVPHENKYKTFKAHITRKKTSILVTNPVTGFRFIESIRKLRHRISQRMKDDKVLMVTSLLENEGKSTIAINIALEMAKKYNNVLLMDCDLHKPACYKLLNQKLEVGVKDVLTGEGKLADAVTKYKNTNMYTLLEHKTEKHAGELLASETMQALLQWARREFDFIVLDMPPMSSVSDVETVMEFADASILVVRQNEARARGINKAVASLESGKAKLLGCVLNNVRSTFLYGGQGSRYGMYGKYRYGHYGHYGSKATGRSGK